MTGTMANAAKGGADSASLYFLKPTYATTIVYLINYEKQE
jgi:hypothetical protein